MSLVPKILHSQKFIIHENSSFYYLENSLAFFNILTEVLLVQKQTIHQQKAWDLSFLEPKGHGPGMVRRVPHLLAAKDIEKKK